MKATCEDLFNPLIFEVHEVEKPVRDLFPAYMKEQTYKDKNEWEKYIIKIIYFKNKKSAVIKENKLFQ